jgi:hypothetical protein
MGDILQTPQFQMRRLKKQLADERSNRDDLELELSESLKLLTEKGGYLTEGVGTGDGEHLGCLGDSFACHGVPSVDSGVSSSSLAQTSV